MLFLGGKSTRGRNMTYVLFKRVGIGNRNRCSREDTMDPFFTIDKRTTRRTTRRWSDPVRDLTMPVHGTGSDRPELIQSIGSFNKAESSAFEDFLDSRKANSGDDGWDLHKAESEFCKECCWKSLFTLRQSYFLFIIMPKKRSKNV